MSIPSSSIYSLPIPLTPTPLGSGKPKNLPENKTLDSKNISILLTDAAISLKKVDILSASKNIYRIDDMFIPPDENVVYSSELSPNTLLPIPPKDFLGELNDLEREYQLVSQNWNNYDYLPKKFFGDLKYFRTNQPNLLSALQLFLTPSEYALINELCDQGYDSIKMVKPVSLFLFNVAKWSMLKQVRSSFEEFETNFHAYERDIQNQSGPEDIIKKAEIDKTNKRLHKIFQALDKDQRLAMRQGKIKFTKIMCQIGDIPAAHLARFAQYEATRCCGRALNVYTQFKDLHVIRENYILEKEWNNRLQSGLVIDFNVTEESQRAVFDQAENFLLALDNCTTMSQVKRCLKQARVKMELPSRFEDWQYLFLRKKFRRQLVQSFYYHAGLTPLINSENVIELLNKRHEDFEFQVNTSFSVIDNLILESQDWSVEEIEIHFNNSHIHLKNVFTIPDNKEELLERIEEVKEELARQWVDYHHASAQLLEQGTRQAILSKLKVERKFIIYRGIEHVIGIASTIIQLFLFSPKIKIMLAKVLLDKLVGDCPLPGIGLVSILYPDVNLTIDGLLTLAIGHCFAYAYKPHEYSLEGYKISLQMRWIKLITLLQQIIYSYQKFLLWLNVRLVETCMMRLPYRPFHVDERAIHLNEKFEGARSRCQKQIEDLKGCLETLQLKDAKAILQPNLDFSNENGEKFDPIASIIYGLSTADFSLYPESTRHFFEENFGRKLKEENKPNLTEGVREFFIRNECDLIENYRVHQFAQA